MRKSETNSLPKISSPSKENPYKSINDDINFDLSETMKKSVISDKDYLLGGISISGFSLT
jgi:hypothetical protein